MAARPVAGLGLCAGVGGLELGLRLALGPRYRTVGYVERDAFAAAVLVARMADQALDPAPVWDDLETFDGRAWSGRVDLVSAGFPCQPFSDAGRRRGLEDERWVWPDIVRVVEEVGPSVAFFENVAPLVARGLDVVLGDLARLGFDVEWSTLRAADVGAPHRRERLWILAHRHGWRLEGLGRQPRSTEAARDHADGPGGPPLADARGQRRPEVTGGAPGHEGPATGRPSPRDHLADRGGEGLADSEGVNRRPGPRQGGPGREPARGFGVAQPPDGGLNVVVTDDERRGGSAAARRGASGSRSATGRLPLWPPGPDDRAGWAEVTSAGGPQPSVRRVADGLAHRVDRLHAIGNGVVPLVAATAFLGLARRAGVIGDPIPDP